MVGWPKRPYQEHDDGHFELITFKEFCTRFPMPRDEVDDSEADEPLKFPAAFAAAVSR